ncbi:hypothetical protein TNCV_4137761 [Trichonephila clavipes]|nr:hypothetical protein TNCV_4137761 [Trichonephila clavipes]
MEPSQSFHLHGAPNYGVKLAPYNDEFHGPPSDTVDQAGNIIRNLFTLGPRTMSSTCHQLPQIAITLTLTSDI